ncbi:ABC transporter substrate-binding protein [Georgenia deserti]|uniref:ABC transporter substrate-binding protein n=1 Tax=Georgenia deserti TaxID=2093781 RepID=A0ABW4L6Y6_9MICO
MRIARKPVALGAVLVTSLALAACGGGNSPEEAAEAAADGEVAGQIQYTWWGGPGRNERTQEVIDLYMDEHPEVTVNGTTGEFTSHWENMTVQASGGNLPCLPQMQNRTLADYADRGALMPLDDIVESGAIDTSHIPDEVLDSGRGADGNLYMIPYGAAFGSLMVNVTQVEELGLETPPENYDWDWLADWLTQISEETGEPAMSNVGQHTDLFEAWVRSHGEELYDENGIAFEPDTVAGYWEWVNALADSGAIDSAEVGVEQRNQPVEQSDFAAGDRAAHIWPANALGTVQETIDEASPGDELAVFPLPSGSDGTAGSALWLSGLSIAENCENVATAASFIDFFVNDPEAALAYGSDNGANTQTENLEALLEDPELSEAKHAELELYQQLTDAGVGRTLYGQAFAAIFQQEFTRMYEEMALQGTPLDQAAEQFHQEAVSQAGG